MRAPVGGARETAVTRELDRSDVLLRRRGEPDLRLI
jgi:hypothetical protein